MNLEEILNNWTQKEEDLPPSFFNLANETKSLKDYQEICKPFYEQRMILVQKILDELNLEYQRLEEDSDLFQYCLLIIYKQKKFSVSWIIDIFYSNTNKANFFVELL